MLSFEDEEEEEEETEATAAAERTDDQRAGMSSSGGDSGDAARPASATETAVVPRRFATLGKDPTVDSHFLPDRDRELAKEALRDQLRKEWVEKQVRAVMGWGGGGRDALFAGWRGTVSCRMGAGR